MSSAAKLFFVVLLLLLITTGCWNMKEPNQLAFVLGNGLDLTEDGKMEASVLVVTPEGIGGGHISGGDKNQSFQVISAVGKNVSDAFLVNIQSKVSRVVFPGHRNIFLVGQRLAEHGMGEIIDPYIRNPHSDLRPLIYMVKNGQPKDVLNSKPLFDPYITTSLVEEQRANGLKPYLAREFVIDVLSDGTQPLLPVVSLNSLNKYSYSGSAIFNKDDGVKLVGFLNREETSLVRWITNRLNSATLTSFISKGNGNVSITLDDLGRSILVKEVGERIRIEVHLTGEGTIIENNTNLDPSKRKDVRIIQDELSQKTQKSVQKLVKNVQDEYKMDIFGFGERVHQQYPYHWKTLKQNWSENFPKLEVSVKVELKCKDPGQTNSSIY